MILEVTPEQRTDLEQAATAARQTRTWKRSRALLLLADGQTIPQDSTALDCGQSTIYRWVVTWREQGVAGLAEGPHRGRAPRLDAADPVIHALLGSEPQAHWHQATGWTVPLLLRELTTQGWEVHEHTLRRMRKRMGYRWTRPRYVLGRLDPASHEKKGAVSDAVAAMLAAGVRSGWPMRRRCASSRRCGPGGAGSGSQPTSSSAAAMPGAPCRGPEPDFGRTGLSAAGALPHGRHRGGVDGAGPGAAGGAVVPDMGSRPTPHPHRVRDTAAEAGITLAFLPFRSRELMPLEEVWRGLKQTVAANRCYASLEELVRRALAWLTRMTNAERSRRCGLQSSEFEWLPT